MRRLKLGETGTTLPLIGLGTWQYRGSAGVLRAGIELGANFIDTAESYGTESIVAEAIRGRRHEVFVATKVSPRHFKYRAVIAAAEASLQRLNTDCLDLYQLHWPNYTVPIEETMQAMETLVDAGKIRYIGVSNFMLRDLQEAQRAMRKHRIASNQVRYSLIDRTIEQGLLSYCQDQGITVIAFSPLGTNLRRILANDRNRVLSGLAEQKHRTAAQIALNWCISKPGVVTIPKSELMEHVRDNCSVSGFELSYAEIEQLNTGVTFHYRGNTEIQFRRLARHLLQRAGMNQ